MNNKLQKKFDSLENLNNEMFQFIATQSSEKLHFKSAQSDWNMLQIMEHLFQAESISIKSMKARLILGNLNKSGLGAKLRSLLAFLVLRSQIKYKAPSMVSNFSTSIDLIELQKNWKEKRLELKEVLLDLNENKLNTHIFHHPVAGKLNIFGAIDFFYEHSRRHFAQIKLISKKYERL